MESVVLYNEIPDEGLVSGWKKFVKGHPAGTLFQSPEFYSLWLKVRGYSPVAVIIHDNNEVRGVMQGVIIGNPLPAARFFSSRAIFWNTPLVEGNDDEITEKLIEGIDKSLKGHVIYAEIRNPEIKISSQGFIAHGYKEIAHLDIYNDLTLTESEMFGAIHKERRRNIGRALKKGVTVRITTDIREIEYGAGLIRRLYRRIGLPAPPSGLLECAASDLGDSIKIFVAEYEKKIIGARFVLLFRDVVYDWYAGSDPEFHNKYVNDLMPWDVMSWSSKNGFKIFDFGGAGSPDEDYGVRDYKLRYGGKLTTTVRYRKVFNHVLMWGGEIGIKVIRIIKKISR